MVTSKTSSFAKILTGLILSPLLLSFALLGLFADRSYKKVKVQIFEIEWLERNLASFLQFLLSNELTFDNDLVRILLNPVKLFWYPLFFFIFMPFMVYFGLVSYYFCFILSDAYEPRTGIMEGSRTSIAIRILIFIFTGY